MPTSRGEQVTRGEEDSCKAKAELPGFCPILSYLEGSREESMLFSKSNFYMFFTISGSVLAAAPLAYGHF